MKNLSMEFRADIGMIFVAIAFGLGYLPTAWAIESNDVFVLLFWRFFIASVVIAALFWRKIKSISRTQIRYGVVLSLFLFAGFVSQAFAMKFAASSSVAFIVGLNVALVPFIASILFGYKIYSYAYIGVAFAVAGLYLICQTELGFGAGEILALVCASAYSFHIVLTANFVRKCEIFSMVYVQIASLSLFCALASYFVSGVGIAPVLDTKFFIAMIFICLVGTVFGFFAQALMQRYTTPIKVALFFTLEPVTAGIMGVFVGGEILNRWQILGAVLIIAGVLISEIGSYFKAKNQNLG